MLVRHDRHAATGDRQHDMLADNAPVSFIIGMNRYGHIGEHGLGPRSCDLDIVAAIS